MKEQNSKRKQTFKIIMGIAAIIFVSVLCYFIGRPLVHFVSEPEKFQLWVAEKGFLGVLAFMGMNILQVFLAVIPGGPFEIGAGYAFGILKGTIICDISMTLASVLIFLFVRRFGMRFVELFVSREQIESVKILKSSGRKERIVFLLFLIPGTPKDLLSYLIGLSDIKLSHWIFISAVGRLPAIFLSVLSGSALGQEKYHMAIFLFAAIIVLYIIGICIYQFHNRKKAES
ncbi:MAG: VTT domain-containing protein [Lachnospiraceae bacterium]|nr:VTT domain-containing protein [Lachnospiraceae bacterium]